MAVLQMQRISICAMKKNRKAILERLQELGAMEIDIQLSDESGYKKMDITSSKATFEKQAQTADHALEILQAYVPEKAGLLASLNGKPLIDRDQFTKAARGQDNYIETARRVVALDKQIAEQKANIQKIQNQIEALVPWMGLTVPVSYTGTRKTSVLIGTMAGAQSLEALYGLLAKGAPQVEALDIQIISTDKDYTYLAVVCLNKDVQAVEEALRAGGFAKPAQSVNKVPSEYQKELQAEMDEAVRQISALEKEIVDSAGSRQDLRMVSDYYRIRAEKYEILGQLPQTRNTFALSGYVPAFQADKVVKEFSEKYDAVVETEMIQEEEVPPVLLKNNGFSESVEGVLASFGLPGKGEMDPTFFTSVFYVFLFGLMLSDAAYGLIVALACGILLVKCPRMATNLRKSIKLFFWCGISTLIWGIMFGGYFGDVVDVVSETFFGHKVTIPALWFVPLNDPMRLLLYSMLFGVIHLFTGLALKGYMCIRDGRYMDFVCDCVLWFLLLLGLIGMLLPTELFAGIAGAQIYFPEALKAAVKWMAIIGAVGIVLMSGRANKNFGVRIALGAYDLYGMTSWLSDVLSYSRLLALGLATGVIASVVNQMGSMGGKSIIGVILFIVVFLIGHTFNIGINLLGAYVHTCRLQYVEFFGKFYEGGGKAFEPFMLKTKYVDIKEEN
ncbi:MAG: V-type ATP synthase subunit I [Lachnospiraceae bacterium]|nr:V-type ATP synthase subunit I [Lachnospiraceae bacterium]